jgi:hypothetical protein
MGLKWYQSTAYDFPIRRLIFLFYFKGPCPFKFKEKFFSGLVNFLRGVLGKCGVRCKLMIQQRHIKVNCVAAECGT